VRTARARHKIRQWINKEEADASASLGREILERELRRRRLAPPGGEAETRAAQQLSLGSADGLFQALGRGDVPIGQVIRALYPERGPEELEAPAPTALGRVIDRFRLRRGVRVQGLGGLLVRYAQCCQPVPGDPVIGFVTQGRGISIHRTDCPNLLTMPQDADRRVEIDWQSAEGEVFVVALGVVGADRRGLFADLMEAISGTGTNIKSAELSSKDGAMFGTVMVEVEHSTHLSNVMRAMRRVKGVHTVERRDAVTRGEQD
jgi:GTP pyrophosphokinase